MSENMKLKKLLKTTIIQIVNAKSEINVQLSWSVKLLLRFPYKGKKYFIIQQYLYV